MTIISTALPFCLAGVLVSQATTVQVICLGRALAGLCIGAMSLSLPVYLAECLRPEVRGRLGLLPTTLGNLGVLICFICGAWLDWAEVKFALLPEGCKKQQITSHPLKNKSTPTSLRNTDSQGVPEGCLGTSLQYFWGRSNRTSCKFFQTFFHSKRCVINADNASKGNSKVSRMSMAAITHLLPKQPNLKLSLFN